MQRTPNVLEAAGLQIVEFVSRDEREQPPDCEATLDGQFSGIEVMELVHRTARRSIRREGSARLAKSRKRPEVLFDWDHESLLSALRDRFDLKQRPWQGGPYHRRVLVRCTDEFFLGRMRIDQFVRGATFQNRFFTDVVLGLSYQDGCFPVFHFAGSDGSGTLTLQPYLFVARYDVYPFAGAMVEEYPSKDSMIQLILKRASASRFSSEWNDDDYHVLADRVVVGRIFKANAVPVGSPWMWTLAFGYCRTPTHGYATAREAAMAAFAKSWRRE
jgi:hypothetical protein